MVTGGTGGIGGAIAQALRDAGAEVLATGLGAGEVAAAETAPAFAGIAARPLDVADPAAVRDLVDSLDRLDILVNAAGMIVRGGAGGQGGEFEVETFQRVVEVNLTGSMRLATACRPLLAERGGAVVNIASMLSFFGSGASPAYSASKGGVAQLTKSLAIAWAPDRIRVNAIAPGWIETTLTKPLQQDAARSAAIIARTPLGRWGRPEDIGGAAVFLCSPAAAFVTGVVLPVDGGYAIA
ncbi:short-chain dehydrogenase [Aliidongia dinghuensis]|uniref:Short-chain dehydrogenase n=1 Tax=Aliidongia dinghuensis TaxID=1867774 RepID=A0A8J2YYA1_9PROT|nr:short-chain dehydrogenase [Aliidongia dinghuensis]